MFANFLAAVTPPYYITLPSDFLPSPLFNQSDNVSAEAARAVICDH
jgi:hypothetical protein